MANFDFSMDMQVRDYECDLQGVVNNAVYQNYLEHCRHEYLKTLGIDFAELTGQGVHLVLVRAELDYKFPLRSGDRFRVGTTIERVSPLRFAFEQDIFRYPDQRLVLHAKIIGTAVNEKGRPQLPERLAKIFQG